MNRNLIINKLGNPNNRAKLIVNSQSTYDIINQIRDQHNINLPYARKIAYMFKGKTFYATCKNLWNFLKNNVEYKIEGGDQQSTKTIQRLMADGHGDCKHYSNFINPILHSIYGPYTFVYRFASYGNSVLPQHVYAVAISPENGREIYIDPVLNQFNKEKEYNTKIDKKMALYSLSGVKNKATATKTGRTTTSILKRGAVVTTKPVAKSEAQKIIEKQTNIPTANVVTTQPGITIETPPTPFTGLKPTTPAFVPVVTPEQAKMKEKLARIKKVLPKIISQLESDQKMRDWVAGAWGLDMVPVYKKVLEEWDDVEKRNKRLLAIATRFYQVAASEQDKKNDKGNLFDRVIDGVENTFNDAVDFAKNAVTFVFRGVKYYIGLIPRLAFTSLVRLNVFGLATKLYAQKAKNRNSVKDWWNRMGSFDFSTLEQAINLGVKQKAILNGTYIGVDPATIGTTVATATPVIVAALEFLKASGVDVKELEDAAKNNPDFSKGLEAAGKISDAAQKFKQPADKAGELYRSYQKFRTTTKQTGTGEGGSSFLEEFRKKMKAQKGGGISTNTLLLIGGAAVAAFLIFKKKK